MITCKSVAARKMHSNFAIASVSLFIFVTFFLAINFDAIANKPEEVRILGEGIYFQRLRKLQEMCAKLNLTTGIMDENVIDHDIIISIPNQIAYCGNGKAGTTTWYSYFRDLANLPPSLVKKWRGKFHTFGRILFNLPAKLGMDEKTILLHNALKITFVRHPFTRLVSTYRDKVVDSSYKNWRQTIFNDFPSSSADDDQGVSNIPNFEQFVDFVLSKKDEQDVHLRYFWKKCDICNINYDIIGKIETFNEDIAYIHNISKLEMFQPKNLHISHGGSSDQVAKEFFAQIRPEKAKKLAEMYAYDFLLFGYDPSDIVPFLKL